MNISIAVCKRPKRVTVFERRIATLASFFPQSAMPNCVPIQTPADTFDRFQIVTGANARPTFFEQSRKLPLW